MAAGVFVLLVVVALIFGDDPNDSDSTAQTSTVTMTETVTAAADPDAIGAPVAAVEFNAADAVASPEPAAWAGLTAAQQLEVAKRWIEVEQPGVAAGALLKTTDNMEGPRPRETMRDFLTRATARTQARANRVQAARAKAKAARARAARAKAARVKATRERAAQQRRAAAAAARAQAAARARAEQEARDAAAAASACDPNYTGACVPPYPPDVNCADIGTSVQVVGSDPHGLDGDGDGWGCESY